MTVGVLHFLCGLLVLAEALNKLQRCHPLRRGLGWRLFVTEWLKAIAWAMLALGGGGAVATPFLDRPEVPTVRELCVLLGFAVLIVRTRVKEG